jgi:hypothetical protein
VEGPADGPGAFACVSGQLLVFHLLNPLSGFHFSSGALAQGAGKREKFSVYRFWFQRGALPIMMAS